MNGAGRVWLYEATVDSVLGNLTRINNLMYVLDEELYGVWSGWGECSVTCGSGSQTRYRERIGTHSGIDSETEDESQQEQVSSEQRFKETQVCSHYCPGTSLLSSFYLLY